MKKHPPPIPGETAAEPVRDAPAFDFYPERWLVGVAGLSDAEQLSYLRLLCHQWLLQGLPADVAALKRLAGRGVTPAVLAKLPLQADGRRRNARLEEVRREQRERIAKSRAKIALMNAARASGRPPKAAPQVAANAPVTAPAPAQSILQEQHVERLHAPQRERLQEPLRERPGQRLRAALQVRLQEPVHDALGEGREEVLQEGMHDALQEGLEEGLQEGLGEHLQEGLQRRLQEGLEECLGEDRGERLGGFLTAHHPPPTTRVPEDANDAGARAREAAAGRAVQEEPGWDARWEDDAWEQAMYAHDAAAREAADAAADAAAAAERVAEARHAAAASPPRAVAASAPAARIAPLAAPARPVADAEDAEPTPSLATTLAWAEKIGCPPDKAEIWWHEHEARPLTPFGRWTDRDGQSVRSPQHALTAWWQKWKANDFQRATRLNPPSTSYHHAARAATPRSDTANAPGRYA